MYKTDVKFEVTRFALTTGAASTTQDITIPGFGTPKAAIFIWGSSTANDTITADCMLGFGFTDGVSDGTNSGAHARDGIAEANSTRWNDASGVMSMYDNTDVEIAAFRFNGWIDDGVQIIVNDASATAHLITVILIGGDDVARTFASAAVSLETGGPANIDITDPGFEPDLVFLHSNNTSTVGGNNGFLQHFGICHNDGQDTQKAFTTIFDDAKPTTDVNTILYDAAIGGQTREITGEDWRLTCGSFDSQGFSLTTDIDPSSDKVWYLAIKFLNKPNIKLFDISIPTSGDYAESQAGFSPMFGLMVGMQGVATRNTNYAGDIGRSITAFGASSIFANNSTEQNGVGTTVSKSHTDSRLKLIDGDGSTVSVLADSRNFTADGWNFELTTNPAAALLGFGLAIGRRNYRKRTRDDLWIAPYQNIPKQLPAGELTIDRKHPFTQGILSAFIFKGFRSDEIAAGDAVFQGAQYVDDCGRSAEGITQTGTERNRFDLIQSRSFNKSRGAGIMHFRNDGAKHNAARILQTNDIDLHRGASDTEFTMRMGSGGAIDLSVGDIWDGNEWIIAWVWEQSESFRWMGTIDEVGVLTSDQDFTAWSLTGPDPVVTFLNTGSGTRESEGISAFCYLFDYALKEQTTIMAQALRLDPFQFIIPKGRGR